MQTYDIPSDISSEIEKFESEIKEFRKGEINPVQFKGIRVGQGVYEQRKDDTYMLRIRCSGGVITPKQLKAVSEISERYGADHFHVTTRQDVQLHYVELENTSKAYEELIAAGLSPRGGGGNTIRNIMASIDSGISKDEEFDVLPYATALTSRMIAEDDSWNLPRKFKTAFSNSAADNCEATITCLGFIANKQDGKEGFTVYIGGGMGAKPMPGQKLYEFIDAEDVYSLTKAIKIMFDKNGNRRKRFQSKIKFLVAKLGIEEFRNKVEEEWEIIKASNPTPLDIARYTTPNESQVSNLEAIAVSGSEFEQWKTRYVTAQKQDGLYSIKVPLNLGDIYNDDGVKLANLLEPFGENVIRLAFNQNLHIINISEAYLGNIFKGLNELRTQSTQPVLVSNMIACTGAATCRLGLCLPRGVLPETAKALVESDLDIDSIPDFKIHVSGCPNTCGRHHSGDIGLFGKAGRKEKVNYPAYNVLAGAVIGEGPQFAKKVCEVSAKDAPTFLKEVVALWLSVKGEHANFRAFIDADGAEKIAELSKNYQVPAITENADYYTDWGAKNQFDILHGQKAECSAGVFDMIDVDVRDIRQTTKDFPEMSAEEQKEAAYHVVVTAARMLLVTRDIVVKDDEHALIMFDTHFIETSLIPATFKGIIELAETKDKEALLARSEECLALGDALLQLYKSMDDSLRFPQAENA